MRDNGCRDAINFFLALLLVLGLFIAVGVARPNGKNAAAIRWGVENIPAHASAPLTKDDELECAIIKFRISQGWTKRDSQSDGCFR